MQQAPTSTEPENSEFDSLTALYRQREFEGLLTAGAELLARHPQSAMINNILGGANAALKRRDIAMAHYQRAIALKPDLASAHTNLGNLLRAMGRNDDAIASYRRAIEIQPGYVNAHYNLGNALRDGGRLEDAVSSYRQALAINPDLAAANNNLGNVLRELNRLEEAAGAFEEALRINPGDSEAHYNLGLTQLDRRRPTEAVASLKRSLSLNSGFHKAYVGMGQALMEIGDRPNGIAHLTRALEMDPDDDPVRAIKLHQQSHVCDWDGVAADAALIPQLGIRGAAVSPFAMLVTDDSPARQLARAKNHVREQYPAARHPVIPHPATKPERLRIGYFSSDLQNHATMYLSARMFELHDRSRFEIHVYNYGTSSDDEMRRRLLDAVEHHHDIHLMDDQQAADLARSHGIDVAVDLKGYTKDNRVGIFAWRPAPVQITYEGYPGTLGAPFIDYLIADKIVIPEAEKPHYSENIIYLPGSYQPTDNTGQISARAMSRSDLGLPEEGFVFCCFNANYKITAVEFDIWMRLLDKVDGSVLWLFSSNPWSADNLRKQAARRGVDPARLIFTDHVPHADHLARISLADLFLDTFACNAHTTANDALWAGLPVLTLAGQSFTARVAASLLHAIELPELVTTTPRDYEALALELATERTRMKAIRAKLAANRLTTALFDSEGKTRAIEQAYEQAYQRWFDGEPPAPLEITS